MLRNEDNYKLDHNIKGEKISSVDLELRVKKRNISN